MTETEIYILGPALRQHMQKLSWSCLTGFLPVELGFNSRGTCISSFLKRFGATVCCESLSWCQIGCSKQIQIFPWKKSCLVHLLAFPLSMCCSPFHFSIALSTLGLCLYICIWSLSVKDIVLSKCCPLPCSGILEGSDPGDVGTFDHHCLGVQLS